MLLIWACFVSDAEWKAATDRDGDGHVADVLDGGTDCDDANGSVHPDADELCDGVDNDCDGGTDEFDAVDAVSWYRDTDGDGAGDASDLTQGCSAPSGFVESAGDCDDDDASVSPTADEVCGNGVDDDCDDVTDEDCDTGSADTGDDTAVDTGSDTGDTAMGWVDPCEGWKQVAGDDFESGTAGTTVAGQNGWTCPDGSCGAVYTTDQASEGAQSMRLGGEGGDVGRADAFDGDVCLAWDFWDTGAKGHFAARIFEVWGTDLHFVGFPSWCDDGGSYCAAWRATTKEDATPTLLGERSKGWHSVRWVIDYGEKTGGSYVACIDEACSDAIPFDGSFTGMQLVDDAGGIHIDDYRVLQSPL